MFAHLVSSGLLTDLSESERVGTSNPPLGQYCTLELFVSLGSRKFCTPLYCTSTLFLFAIVNEKSGSGKLGNSFILCITQ